MFIYLFIQVRAVRVIYNSQREERRSKSSCLFFFFLASCTQSFSPLLSSHQHTHDTVSCYGDICANVQSTRLLPCPTPSTPRARRGTPRRSSGAHTQSHPCRWAHHEHQRQEIKNKKPSIRKSRLRSIIARDETREMRYKKTLAPAQAGWQWWMQVGPKDSVRMGLELSSS